MAGIAPTDFDEADPREAAILRTLDSEGVVLWRSDGNRDGTPADGAEVQLVGLVAGEDGPDVFMASAWVSYGTNVRVQLRAPLADACRNFLPGTAREGGLAAQELHFSGHDGAVAAAVEGSAKFIARWANQDDGAFLLRVTPSGGGEKRLAVARVATEDRRYVASIEFEAGFPEVLAFAEETFGRPPSPGR